MVNVVWLQKWTQTTAPCYKATRPSHLRAKCGDIYQAELDDRTASARNETKQRHAELRVTLLTLVRRAWCEHTDAVAPLWSSSAPKPP